MDVSAPMHVTEHLSWMGLGMIGVVGLGVLFILAMILSTFTGRTRHVRHSEQVSSASPHRSRSTSAPVVVTMVALSGAISLAVVLFLTLADSRQERATEALQVSQIESRTPSQALDDPQPLPKLGVSDSKSNHVNGDTEESSSSTQEPGVDEATEPLPEWTRTEETVLAAGQVPRVLFVETSGLYSSESEALAEATNRALSKFHTRLAETYHELAAQPLPEKIFREASIQQVYTEKRIHSFGVYDEPMYRVYLQYMDSAEAREPVVEAWKSTFATNRAMKFGVMFGILTVLLGVVSAGLRAVSAAKGSRSRSVMTALAFAGAGAVTLLVLA